MSSSVAYPLHSLVVAPGPRASPIRPRTYLGRALEWGGPWYGTGAGPPFGKELQDEAQSVSPPDVGWSREPWARPGHVVPPVPGAGKVGGPYRPLDRAGPRQPADRAGPRQPVTDHERVGSPA